MSSALVLLLSLLCLTACVQCYGGGKYGPLGKLTEVKRSKKSVDYLSENDVVTEYSPVYIAPQEGLKEADKILTLPGQPKVNFSQYSGYVTVDAKAGRALFYYFTESEDPSSKPLVLWLNGGPGCSSIGGGAMTEQGPFRVNPDGKTLWYNKYAWNTVANVLFLESPAGVGFSYSNTSSDYIIGDKKTAADSYTFLVNWLERFPDYKTRDFYITGESYAGHYVPQLADLILENNKITNQTVINLKGIAIGNAYIDYTDRWAGTYDHFWTSALISDEIHEGIISNCNFSSEVTISDVCEKYTDQADEAIGNIFIYDIYAPLCSSSSNAPLHQSGFDPCSDDYVFAYLNTPEVQQALHANTTGVPGPWEDCNYTLNGDWQDMPDTVLPTIKKLMASGISVWIYSGDTDGIIPVTTTRSRYGPLGKLTKGQHSKRSVDYLNFATEYSPVYAAPQERLKEADKIVNLPGQPKVNFSQYSGYITVDPKGGRALFYYFTESEDPSSKPLVLWLNGGPGCSSIGGGAMIELGPFQVNPDGKTLRYNNYAWNKVANVLFLESRAGVGFSYSNTTSNYVIGDKKTAADSYTFLINWLERFPEYKTLDFYVTGESYAGHYVPQLADLILETNKIKNQTVINLKGIAIGNANIDYTDRWTGTYDHHWTSALISDEIHEGVIKNCNFSSAANFTEVCQEYTDRADKAIGNIFIYDIYAPLCSSSLKAPSVSGFDPCSDDYVFAYLNTPEVQR
ncbi:unnamed protein product [Fraxinus pennsylvanica]|uniref:Carboxypeptidase n=1 Tax=Fraxinus pennsylvanica TaxID=56036 RepID=A0AAD1Z9B1_9LAMI|nr:unnamed protein product [Fraxinus pennsylvanica]